MEEKEFNYKDFYKPDVLNGSTEMYVQHLIGKYEKYFGILEVVRFGIPLRYGINTKEVLEKSLQYYNKQSDTSAHWYYMDDVLKLEKEHAIA